MLMTCQYLRIAYCLLPALTVERAREKATCRRQSSADVPRPAPLSLLHRRRHRRRHHDRLVSRRQTARALRRHVSLRLDSAARGGARGAALLLLCLLAVGGRLGERPPVSRLGLVAGDVSLAVGL